MNIYYLMIEAVPKRNTPEYKEFGGAYINCWVKAATQSIALKKAKECINNEHWKHIKLEDIWVAYSDLYADTPESLDCYNEACEKGFSAIYYTWPIDDIEKN